MEISIITASYNCSKTIEETINSVLGQTYKKWQLIIFDDGSTDTSLDIIRRYCQKDKRIKLFNHPGNKNMGLADTLQKAVKCVKTDYFAFLECDDIWQPDYLAQKISLLNKNPEAEIIFNDVSCFGDENRIKKLTLFNKAVKVYLKILNPFNNEYNLNFPLLSFNPIPTFSCVLIKTSLAENYGFQTPFAPETDYWLWARLSFKHKFYFIDKKLTLWRLSKTSYTMRSGNDSAGKKNMHLAIKKLYRQNNNPLIYSFKAGLSWILNYLFLFFSLIFKPVLKIILRAK